MGTSEAAEDSRKPNSDNAEADCNTIEVGVNLGLFCALLGGDMIQAGGLSLTRWGLRI